MFFEFLDKFIHILWFVYKSNTHLGDQAENECTIFESHYSHNNKCAQPYNVQVLKPLNKIIFALRTASKDSLQGLWIHFCTYNSVDTSRIHPQITIQNQGYCLQSHDSPPATIAPVIYANINPNPNPKLSWYAQPQLNPNPNPNSYPMLNQKPSDDSNFFFEGGQLQDNVPFFVPYVTQEFF